MTARSVSVLFEKNRARPWCGWVSIQPGKLPNTQKRRRLLVNCRRVRFALCYRVAVRVWRVPLLLNMVYRHRTVYRACL